MGAEVNYFWPASATVPRISHAALALSGTGRRPDQLRWLARQKIRPGGKMAERIELQSILNLNGKDFLTHRLFRPRFFGA